MWSNVTVSNGRRHFVANYFFFSTFKRDKGSKSVKVANPLSASASSYSLIFPRDAGGYFFLLCPLLSFIDAWVKGIHLYNIAVILKFIALFSKSFGWIPIISKLINWSWAWLISRWIRCRISTLIWQSQSSSSLQKTLKCEKVKWKTLNECMIQSSHRFGLLFRSLSEFSLAGGLWGVIQICLNSVWRAGCGGWAVRARVVSPNGPEGER